MNPDFLYKILDTVREFNPIKQQLPEIIATGLSKNIVLRDYQINAFNNFFINYEKESQIKQIHNLFHMATGSGKTVIMAGLILYLYTKGYRKFLFFVNQTNVLKKTIDNFTNTLSNKYLFNETIEYNGSKIKIKRVSNFTDNSINNNDIEIVFTTTQKLHLDLTFVSENSLTYHDFENNKVVFISDESHHINSSTKKSSKQEIEESKTWETSVMNAFRNNKENVLLEFTATCDLLDKNVLSKYKDKIVFNYPLFDFRKSGFTKDFKNFATNTDLFTRALISLVLSEYRKFLFADLKLNIKPVVLFKSQKIDESNAFYNEFFRKIKNIDSSSIKDLEILNINILNNAIDYFIHKDSSLDLLVKSIKNSFTPDSTIIMNGSTDNSKEKQLLVNSLEDESNPIRLIFAVDMLNEGWDVLNLFDIVRLYDTRQGGKTKVTSYTIKEAQLIGRGARYCPFIFDNDEDFKYKRKFDYDIENQHRILETMLFHSKNDSAYIQELKRALIETGLQDDQMIELKYELKESFKSTEFYEKAFVFSNKRELKSRKGIRELEPSFRNKIHYYTALNQSGRLVDLFEEESENSTNVTPIVTSFKFKDIPLNVLTGASDCFEELKFNKLKEKYPNLKTKVEFLTSNSYLGNSTLEITHVEGKLSTREIFNGLKRAFKAVASHILSIKPEYEGTRQFNANLFNKVVKNKTIHISKTSSDSGQGVSQNNTLNPEYHLDLSNEKWYVFNDNYGTTEEKAFLKYFKQEIASILDNYNLEYYVVRNERFKELAIFSFEYGERFEPDFLLFINKKQALSDKRDATITYQAYIEPKGEFIKEKDSWKEVLLENIELNAVPQSSYISGKYEIFGLPFFTQNTDKEKFKSQMIKIIRKIIEDNVKHNEWK
ncbi:DEAD/DEAH box helicase family protein [Mycoplasmopsis bovis]|uniref:DEAD/DEAH box helicase family protein n=1 Tax=Mycoplasmopsis bovis TaxID=28903 RepID=UPI0027A8638E